MDDDGEPLLLLDREIEDVELPYRPVERRALPPPLVLDFVGSIFDDDRGDVCSGGVGGRTLSTSPLLLLPDFFLIVGIFPIFFFFDDDDGADGDDEDDCRVAAISHTTNERCCRGAVVLHLLFTTYVVLVCFKCNWNVVLFSATDHRHFIGMTSVFMCTWDKLRT